MCSVYKKKQHTHERIWKGFFAHLSDVSQNNPRTQQVRGEAQAAEVIHQISQAHCSDSLRFSLPNKIYIHPNLWARKQASKQASKLLFLF